MFGKKKNTEEHHSLDPLDDILAALNNCLQTPTEIRDKKVICTDWNIVITPKIENLDNRCAVLNFYLDCPDWDEPLFECCAGVGQDANTAIGNAVGSFIFAFMHGIYAMQTNSDPISIESEYAGAAHRWQVYKSDIVGIGDEIEPDFADYWEILKDGIIKRLGNQRMCYVKVYAAKAVGKDGESITGECRVNDVPSEELGALVAEVAAKMNVKQFASQKMFFFIKQSSQTLLPYPYRMNKIPELREKVKTALETFLNAEESEKGYDDLLPDLVLALQDGPLAEECFMFLPEICAERAFGDQIQFSEQIQICIGGGEKTAVLYKNQLADFFTLGNLMFMVFDSGYFKDKTNDLYNKLIRCSSIGNAVYQVKSEGKELDGIKMTALLFNPSPKFELR